MSNRAKRMINRILSLGGLQLSRIQQPGRRTGYYPVAPTCQIPYLSTIYEEIFGTRTSGFFVEIGAYDGESFSNTSCLADRGWAGLLVEPVPEFAAKARHRHRHNQGVKVVEKAVGRTSAELEITIAGALSSVSGQMVAAYQDIDWARDSLAGSTRISVPQVTLDTLLTDQNVAPGFDVMVVDTEGYESEVMAGFALEQWRPKLMIIELADFHPDIRHRRDEDRAIGDRILGAGYGIIYKDAINTVFRRHSD